MYLWTECAQSKGMGIGREERLSEVDEVHGREAAMEAWQGEPNAGQELFDSSLLGVYPSNRTDTPRI